MKDAQKPDHVSLGGLIRRIKDGKYVIPDFQREFEWSSKDVRDLILSIFNDYYVGTLLLWKGKKENFDALSCEPIFAFEGESRPEFIVLDGQQRITALHYACFAPDRSFPNRKNPVVFWINIRDFLIGDDEQSFGYYQLTQNWKNLLQDKESQYHQHIFPLSVIGKGDWEIAGWANDYEEYWKKQTEAAKEANDQDLINKANNYCEGAREFKKHLEELTQDYQISYIYSLT